ncbi:MAG: atpase badf/badg/bcra/bcrd type [Parcubacteria group bacterium Gr01-1014_30]|nr:MAG: atpase badf/badg/bcra/bcrd type [Parcubacteria group bacterium Gr01-1014_30]
MRSKNHSRTSTTGYVIGVDGGGTKTIAALANLQGKILKMGKSGASSPRNVGIEKTARNVAKAVKKVLPKERRKVLSIFVGLPAVQEEFESKVMEIKKIISRQVKGKLAVGSDQLVAFRSGTDSKDGIVLIAGTGCVAHGWKGKKEHKSSGWGWLADEGSGFWIGQRVFQAAFRDFDGRGPKTSLKVPIKKIYAIYAQNFVKEVSSLSIICDQRARKGDKVSKLILTEAGRELAESVKTVVKKLNLAKNAFPLVLIGSVLKSKIVLEQLKRGVKKYYPKVQFVQPEKEPVTGAVKLAIEQIRS